jgi:hypothetical protein
VVFVFSGVGFVFSGCVVFSVVDAVCFVADCFFCGRGAGKRVGIVGGGCGGCDAYRPVVSVGGVV